MAIPGRVVAIERTTPASISGRILVNGVERDVDLVMVPEAVVGDYVVVHSGYAIRRLPSDLAAQTLSMLDGRSRPQG